MKKVGKMMWLVGLLCTTYGSLALAGPGDGVFSISPILGINVPSKSVFNENGRKHDDVSFNKNVFLEGQIGVRVPVENLIPIRVEAGAGVEFNFRKSFEGSAALKELKNSGCNCNDTEIFKYLTNLKPQYLPIYFFVQVYPLISLENEYLKGIYLKGEIGAIPYFSSNLEAKDLGVDIDDKGGIYYGGGIGYTLPFNLFFEAIYSVRRATIVKHMVGFEDKVIKLSVGYKFSF
jgi:hypothetical protein